MKYALLFFLSFSTVSAQQYPKWFLFQDKFPCKSKVVTALRAPSLYKDTAVAVGFRAGCGLLAKYTNVRVKGGQAFWRTEAGVHSMGSEYVELYDTSLADFYQSSLKVVDSYIDRDKAIVLAGDSSMCSMPKDLSQVVRIQNVAQPKWVEELPDNNMYYYGVGTSEQYYYESSSWERAEHNAFMSIARTTHSKVISMQKSNAIESQEVFNEDVDVELQNIEVVARWRDVKKKVFYVMMRSKK